MSMFITQNIDFQPCLDVPPLSSATRGRFLCYANIFGGLLDRMRT